MIRVFQSPTQVTEFRARPIAFFDLISRRKATSEGLPEENLNLRRDLRFPNARESSRSSTTNQSRVQRFDREYTRGRKRPNHRVGLLREHREEGRKTLPFFQLFRRQGPTKSQVPIISIHLRDGDLRIGAIREQNRKANSQGSIPGPPI